MRVRFVSSVFAYPILTSSQYKAVFKLARQDGQRNVDRDLAVAIWAELLPLGHFALTDAWLAWVAEEGKLTHSVSADLWNMLLQFLAAVKTQESVSEDDCWPSQIDRFCEETAKAK